MEKTNIYFLLRATTLQAVDLRTVSKQLNLLGLCVILLFKQMITSHPKTKKALGQITKIQHFSPHAWQDTRE